MDRSFRATFGRAAGIFTQRDGGEADGEVGDGKVGGKVDDGKATDGSSDGCKVDDDEADDSGGDGSGDSIAVGTCLQRTKTYYSSADAAQRTGSRPY
jgi:hypothetical protein